MSAARQRLEEHGITWDEDGAPQGFLVGKAAAISEWKARRQKKADQRYFKLLYCAAWKRRRRRENGDGMRETHRAWYARNRDRIQAQHAEWLRRWRERHPRFHTCEQCGITRKVEGRIRSAKRFCSTRCRNRWHYLRHRYKGAGRIDVVAIILGILRARPWQSFREILAADERLLYGSTATCLHKLQRSGRIVTDTVRKGRRFALAVPEEKAP